MDRDPVCGMTMRPGQEEDSIRYGDQPYHFCSSECKRMFEKDPKKYINQEVPATAR